MPDRPNRKQGKLVKLLPDDDQVLAFGKLRAFFLIK